MISISLLFLFLLADVMDLEPVKVLPYFPLHVVTVYFFQVRLQAPLYFLYDMFGRTQHAQGLPRFVDV